MRMMSNIAALNSSNKLKLSNQNKTKSTEKISSGLRINRAADDAAGLAISEKMRGQIRGLEQASRNVQDGISLVQTAEGAMQEIHNMLQRMNELAVQSSNGTYSDNDRYNIHVEFENLKKEIDEISETTHFNGIKLLNGNKNEMTEAVSGNATVNWNLDIPTMELSKTSDGGILGVGDFYGSLTAFKLDQQGNTVWTKSISFHRIKSIKETSDGGYILIADNQIFGAPLDEKIKIIKLDDQLNEQWSSGLNGLHTTYGNEVIEDKDGNFILAGAGSGIQNHDGIIAKFDRNGNFLNGLVNGSIESIPVGYGQDYYNTVVQTADGGYLAVGTSSTKIGETYFDNSSWIVKFDQNLNRLWEKRVGGTGDDDGFAAIATSDGGAIIVGSYHDSALLSGFMYKVNKDGDLIWQKNLSEQTSSLGMFSSIIEDNDGNYMVGGKKDGEYYLSLMDSDGVEKAYFTLPGNVDYKTIKSIINNDDGSYTLATNDGIYNVTLSYDQNNQTTVEPIVLQVGDGVKDKYSIDRPDLSTKSIGIHNISLAYPSSAYTAIPRLKKAIETVSSDRSRFGAYQNTLEHINNNVLNYAENLTASESRIRDSDMAKEMMNLTKNQIAMKASQAMLAQANVLPQHILKLIE